MMRPTTPFILKVDGQTYFEMPLLADFLAEQNLTLVEAPLEKAIAAIDQYAPVVIVTGAAPIGKEIIDVGRNKGLFGLVKAGVGLDNIDCEYAQAQGLLVANTPDYVQETVAEYAIGLILALARKLWPLQRTMHAAGWLDISPAWLGMELNRKTIGLIGCGRVAKSMARIARFGFQMSVLAYDPDVSQSQMAAHQVQKVEQLEDLLPECDIVSIHTSLNPSTRNLIGAAQLAAMKPTALLINVSRGGIVDEAALLNALSAQQIGGAALDVFTQEPLDVTTHPLMSQMIALDNVLLSPHIAWYTGESGQRLQQAVCQQCVSISVSRLVS